MIVIQNARIRAEINPQGAELTHLIVDGEERLWQGDPAWWSGRSPVLFPFVGALPQQGYAAEGKHYQIARKHGFARTSLFSVERADDLSAVFLLTDSDATRSVYPYAFALRVTFALEGDTLSVTYRVDNTGDRPLYCSVGSHEAYATPEGVEQYEVVFEQPETAARYLVKPAGQMTGESRPFFDHTTVYRPKASDFVDDAVICKDIRSRRVTLRRQDGQKAVTIAFPGCDYLLFWQKPNAPFFCVEPWSGIGQSDEVSRIEDFEGIHRVEAGENLTRTHTVTVH